MAKSVHLNLLVFFLATGWPCVSHSSNVESLCKEIGNTLGSVSVNDCLRQGLKNSEAYSHKQRPLAYKIYPPLKGRQPLGRILLMGGIHGDEYSAVSILFKWMDKLNRYHSGLFHWHVVHILGFSQKSHFCA